MLAVARAHWVPAAALTGRGRTSCMRMWPAERMASSTQAHQGRRCCCCCFVVLLRCVQRVAGLEGSKADLEAQLSGLAAHVSGLEARLREVTAHSTAATAAAELAAATAAKAQAAVADQVRAADGEQGACMAACE